MTNEQNIQISQPKCWENVTVVQIPAPSSCPMEVRLHIFYIRLVPKVFLNLPACRRQVNIKLWIARPGMNVYYFYWEHAVFYPVPIDQKPVVHLLGWGGMLCSSYMASLFRTQKIASKRRHKRADGSNLFSSCVHGAEMKRKSQFLRWHFCVPSVVVGRNTAKFCSALPNVYFVLLFAFGLILFWTYYRYCSEAMQCVEVGA